MTGEVTLDFCDAKYPSESLRTARYQVAYDKKGDAFSASNEVVAYKPGGAKQALTEVTRAVAESKQGTVKAPAGSPAKQFVRHTTSDPRPTPSQGHDRDPRHRVRGREGKEADRLHDGDLPGARQHPERHLRLRPLGRRSPGEDAKLAEQSAANLRRTSRRATP